MAELKKFVEEGKATFTYNEFGELLVKNSRGETVTASYLRRYVHCWARKADGFTFNRKVNIEYFMSEAYIREQFTAHPDMTASEFGHTCRLSKRWTDPKAKKAAKPRGKKVAAA